MPAGMDYLQRQRLEVAKAIKEEEAEKVRIEQDLAVLQSRLAHIQESLQKKVSLISTRVQSCAKHLPSAGRQHFPRHASCTMHGLSAQ